VVRQAQAPCTCRDCRPGIRPRVCTRGVPPRRSRRWICGWTTTRSMTRRPATAGPRPGPTSPAVAAMHCYWERKAQVASPDGAVLPGLGVPLATGLRRRKRREWKAEIPEHLQITFAVGSRCRAHHPSGLVIAEQHDHRRRLRPNHKSGRASIMIGSRQRLWRGSMSAPQSSASTVPQVARVSASWPVIAAMRSKSLSTARTVSPAFRRWPRSAGQQSTVRGANRGRRAASAPPAPCPR
jgi:hypothetical protein